MWACHVSHARGAVEELLKYLDLPEARRARALDMVHELSGGHAEGDMVTPSPPVTHIEDFPACPCRAVRWGCACVRSVLRAVPVRTLYGHMYVRV